MSQVMNFLEKPVKTPGFLFENSFYNYHLINLLKKTFKKVFFNAAFAINPGGWYNVVKIVRRFLTAPAAGANILKDRE